MIFNLIHYAFISLMATQPQLKTLIHQTSKCKSKQTFLTSVFNFICDFIFQSSGIKKKIVINMESSLPPELLASPVPPVALIGLDAMGSHAKIWKAMAEGGVSARSLR